MDLVVEAERRHFPRIPVDAVGTLELLGAAAGRPAFGVRVNNLSDGGLGLVTGGEIPVGAQVKITVGIYVLSGVVAHCHREHGVFCAGVSVGSGNADSELLHSWAGESESAKTH